MIQRKYSCRQWGQWLTYQLFQCERHWHSSYRCMAAVCCTPQTQSSVLSSGLHSPTQELQRRVAFLSNTFPHTVNKNKITYWMWQECHLPLDFFLSEACQGLIKETFYAVVLAKHSPINYDNHKQFISVKGQMAAVFLTFTLECKKNNKLQTYYNNYKAL